MRPFPAVCQYYEGALGRMLRKSELEILYSVYSGLGMPAEVLMAAHQLLRRAEPAFLPVF